MKPRICTARNQYLAQLFLYYQDRVLDILEASNLQMCIAKAILLLGL